MVVKRVRSAPSLTDGVPDRTLCLDACRTALVKRLGVPHTSLLPIVRRACRCALTAALVALGKLCLQNNRGDSSHVVDQCRQELALRLEQWTEPMWIQHVPAALR